MKLEHSFVVPVGIDEAWRILLDIERIGPCMPGAAIDSVDGDDFTGTVKVKLGPIGLTYKGKASFIEKDEAAHRAVIDARGRDARGNGTASAKVTANLSESGGQTTVKVDTDLDITGKPAQFGRGVMVDVGNKLIGQFADNLAATITDGDAAPPAPAPAAAAAPAKKAAPAKATAPAKKATPAKKAAPRKRAPSPKPADAGKSADASEPATATEPATAAEATATAPAIEEAAVEAVADAPAAFSAPGADAAAVNGHGTKPARPPQRDVEPINLIESAGPAVAKRLAPVALGLVLIVGVWRYRKRNG